MIFNRKKIKELQRSNKRLCDRVGILESRIREIQNPPKYKPGQKVEFIERSNKKYIGVIIHRRIDTDYFGRPLWTYRIRISWGSNEKAVEEYKITELISEIDI